MHNKKDALNIDANLLKIVKSGCSEIQRICKKLEENDNNMFSLSNTEWHKFWYCIRNLLTDFLESTKVKLKYLKTSIQIKKININSDTYSSIVQVALETLKYDYIPDVLPDVVILLNLSLPTISNLKVKDEVFSFLEECWKLKLVKESTIIINVLKHLIERAKFSLKYVIRLHNIKGAIQLLKSFKDIQNVMKLAREKTFLAITEGINFLIYLFTIGEHWIMGIYNNIRVSLQTADNFFIKAYANILIKAWQNSTDYRKTIEDCLENLIFHCLRAKRDANGRNKLGENLLEFLEIFHAQANNNVKMMICDKYFQLIWTCLEAPGCCVRCNAADVLFIAYPMSVSNRILKTNSELKKNSYLNKQHSAITKLLKDSNEKVCIIAFQGMFHILENHWKIPSKLMDEWLKLALEHTKSSNYPEIRKHIFQGFRSLLSKPQNYVKLKEILPKFADSFYDTNVDVRLAVLQLFLQIESSPKMKIRNIMPLKCIIECLASTSQAAVLILLHKLLWTRFSFSKDEESTIQEIIHAGQININVIRTFFLHSKNIISFENALKLLNVILSVVTQEIELLPIKEDQEVRIKRHKPSENQKRSYEISNNENGFNEISAIQILIDVSTLLYAVNREDFLKHSFENSVKETHLKIAEKLRYILEKFENTQISETALFFLSHVPEYTVANYEEFCEKYKRKLLNQSVSDDTILSILHLMIKWKKVDIVLELLPSLLNVNENFSNKLASFAQCEITSDEWGSERQTKLLKLGLRILQFIIQKEFQASLLQENHENMVQFWENLHFIKTLIANRFVNYNGFSSALPDDVLKIVFQSYLSLIPLLHHSDDFRSGNHFSRIVSWVQQEVQLRALNSKDIETDEFAINILKCVLDTGNDMINQFKAPPKLCCEVIILYSKCLNAKCGIAFVNHALVTVLALIKFSTDVYSNDESGLLKTVIPSLFAAVMVTLTKYPVDFVKKYTNNLQTLSDLMKNLFPILKKLLNQDILCMGYMAIVFNTAVFCVSKDFEKLFNSAQFTTLNTINREFPFIAEEIIKIVLQGEGFQELCINVLNKALSKYSTVDQLSSLLIIQKLVKSRNKTNIKNRKIIKNMISSIKKQQHQSIEINCFTTVRDRLINDVKEKLILEILNS